MTRFALITALAMLLCGTAGAQPEPWAVGPVVQNARVIVIYWGAPDPTLRGAIDRFYSQIASSPYLSRLWEYGTGAVSTSVPSHFRSWFGYPKDQVVGSGSYAGSYVILPTTGGNVETTDFGKMVWPSLGS